jgi:hypothetical protein
MTKAKARVWRCLLASPVPDGELWTFAFVPVDEGSGTDEIEYRIVDAERGAYQVGDLYDESLNHIPGFVN